MGVFIGDSEPSKIFVGDTPISKVFLGDTQIRPSGWQPGADTYLYLPMKDDFLDKTGNNIIDNSGVTIQTIDGVKCGYFNNNRLLCDQSPLTSKDITISVWLKTSSSSDGWIIGSNRSGIWNGDYIVTSTSKLIYEAIYGTSRTYDVTSSAHMVSDTRTHLCYSSGRLYVNGQDVTSSTPTFSSFTQGYPYSIGQQLRSNGTVAGYAYIGYMSEYIIESKARTAQEVADYYNQTKGIYGIS